MSDALRRLSLACVLALAAALLAACPQENAMPENLANDENREPYRISLTVPSAGWSLESVEAYRVDDEVWILCQIQPPEGMAAQVISTLEKTVPLPHPELERRVLVLGKTWNWEADDEVQYVESRAAIADALRDAKPISIDP